IEELRTTLEYLRAQGFYFLSIDELINSLRERRPLPRRAVAFTVDDGYFDFAERGARVFAEFDCPVSMFLVTGFLDGELWLWWDKVRYLFSAAGEFSS